MRVAEVVSASVMRTADSTCHEIACVPRRCANSLAMFLILLVSRRWQNCRLPTKQSSNAMLHAPPPRFYTYYTPEKVLLQRRHVENPTALMKGAEGPQIVVAVGNIVGCWRCTCWVSRYCRNDYSATMISGPKPSDRACTDHASTR